jgi:hypothetical protein
MPLYKGTIAIYAVEDLNSLQCMIDVFCSQNAHVK